VKPRLPLLLGALVAVSLPSSTPGQPPASSGHGYWLQAIPESLEEAALRDVLVRSAFSGPAERAEVLARLSAAHPGTATSGLAQLAAGFALLEGAREADAVACLSHPDIRKTSLVAYAGLALGHALEAQSAEKAASAFLAATDAEPMAPTACGGLLGAAAAFEKAKERGKAVATLERALVSCRGQEPQVLLSLARAQDASGHARSAAVTYDRLDREFPASPEARDGSSRLRALSALLPPEPTAERRAREIRRGQALLEAGLGKAAVAAFRAALERKPTGEELDIVRLGLGRALLASRSVREAERQLEAIGSGSPQAAEAAYLLARQRARRGGLQAYETVVERFPGTPWSEEALLQLANDRQKDARDAEAVPYFRRLLKDSPSGRYIERAAWRVGFFDFREGRYEEAAALLESTARGRETSGSTPGFLYWAGRSRAALGQTDRARSLLDETVRRFKNSYHGLRAREALAQLPPRPAGATPAALLGPAARTDLPEPQRLRIRQLLLIDRLDEAAEELRALAPTTIGQATLAWIEWRRGRLRNAIVAMKRAYPEYIGEAGDLLPADVWKILFPIGFEDALVAKATEERIDPALVAALVCQESTFDPGAVSRAGARGLMQIMGQTGRLLARDLGVRYRRAALHDPDTSLDFGTRYLRQMLDRFDGHEERALAAYNAGPHRVEAWTEGRPDISAEEFVESIPFTETRFYVMTVLASREHYRRLYPLEAAAAPATTGGAQP
jgi:soluble lytic murein transglycosylase